MVETLVMPKLGLTMIEGLVTKWLAAVGQPFHAGETLMVVETDKIAHEVDASEDGTLTQIFAAEGATVPVGAPIAQWQRGHGAVAPSPPAPMPAASAPSTEPQQRMDPEPALQAPAAPAEVRRGGDRVVATPLARRLARERGIDLATVTGSGPRGRIRAADLERVMPPEPAKPDPPLPAPARAGTRRSATARERAAAQHLTQAKQVPHAYGSTEVDVGALLDFRRQVNTTEGLPHLTVTHFLAAAVAAALAEAPALNRVWDGDGILTLATIDIGIAIDTSEGLIAPLLRDLELCTLLDIAPLADTLIARARTGRLAGEDLGGGAITISNPGMSDVTSTISIIPAGQSLILGAGSVRQVFRPQGDGSPELRREMTLVLSFDHRVHDGRSALALLGRIKRNLERPLRLLAPHQPDPIP